MRVLLARQMLESPPSSSSASVSDGQVLKSFTDFDEAPEVAAAHEGAGTRSGLKPSVSGGMQVSRRARRVAPDTSGTAALGDEVTQIPAHRLDRLSVGVLYLVRHAACLHHTAPPWEPDRVDVVFDIVR
ncbi:hypothetical protein [Streptomyces rochei]|uniref:hypothetical protein n=1 Tax=Streptomyces rochei TaxID=1928 RepID=UPI00367B9DF2